MNITDIYEAYRIIPNVREHQLRVAAVARKIAENTQGANVDDIITACLLHDMGKIVTFKLKGDELTQYGAVQEEFRGKYGSSEDEATYNIALELGASNNVLGLIRGIGFDKAESIQQTGIIESMICLYADQRVSPKGIVSLDERFAEGQGRFRERMGVDQAREALFEGRVTAIRGIENLIFEKCSLLPDQITDDTIQPLVQELATFEIPPPSLIS